MTLLLTTDLLLATILKYFLAISYSLILTVDPLLHSSPFR